MLRKFNDFRGFGIRAIDGTIGRVEDFYFDDRAWIVRHLVVDAGTWSSSRKVLLSPTSIGRPDGAEKVLRVLLTTEQVKNSPDIDTARPVSRQHEVEAYAHAESKRRRENDPHLRSCRAVLRYRVHASDGDVGHVEDMLVDDQTWAIEIPGRQHQQLVARLSRAHRAAVDPRHQLVRFESLGQADAKRDRRRSRL